MAFKKGVLRSISYHLLIVFLFFSCKEPINQPKGTHSFTGETMGTFYTVKYIGNKKDVEKKAIDSILVALNEEVSTYIPSSIISILNAHESDQFNVLSTSHFAENYVIAEELYHMADGYFDPTLAPLVNFWGFGYTDKDIKGKDKRQVSVLMNDVGFNKWTYQKAKDSLLIQKPNTSKLDFSASAKGYGVDLVAQFIESQGIGSYYVEIGGELRVSGKKLNGGKWTVGINLPKEGSSVKEISQIVQVENESMATSGNYRNFYKQDGVTYSHIINPFTGFPERSSLLSATIIHSSCAYADGIATACMVMGKEKCKALLTHNKDYEGLLLFSDDGTTIQKWQTDDFESRIIQMD